MQNDICFPAPNFRDEVVFIKSEMNCKWKISDCYVEIIHLIRKNASLVYKLNNFYQPTKKYMYTKCAIPENIHPPSTEAIGISWGVGGSVRPKNQRNVWNLIGISREVGGGLRKNPFRGGGIDTFWNHTIKVSKLPLSSQECTN